MRNVFLILISATLIAGCAGLGQKESAVAAYKTDTTEFAQERRDAMVGNWVGEVPLKDGGIRKWLIQRSDEGTYVVTFIVIPSGQEPKVSQEVGFWGISGPIYFSIMKGWLRQDGNIDPTDPARSDFYDAYKIVALTQEEFQYESFSTGSRFTVNKVSDDYSPNNLVNSIGNGT